MDSVWINPIDNSLIITIPSENGCFTTHPYSNKEQALEVFGEIVERLKASNPIQKKYPDNRTRKSTLENIPYG